MLGPVASATTQEAAKVLTTMAFTSFLAGLPADVVLGAFAGAILFVVSASEYSVKSCFILAIGSFTAGITMYKPAAGLIITWLPVSYDRGADAAGAFFAAACVVRLLMTINQRSGGFLNKKGGNDDNP